MMNEIRNCFTAQGSAFIRLILFYADMLKPSEVTTRESWNILSMAHKVCSNF